MFWKRRKYNITDKTVFNLPGTIAKYALNSNRFLYAIIRGKENSEYYKQYLYGISLQNGVAWKSDIKLGYPNELRIDNTGFAWISHSSDLIQIDEEGKLKQKIELPLKQNQEIGSFIILIDGFIVSIQANEQSKPDAKILRINFEGQVIWETKILPEYLSHSGVVEMKASNNWKVEKKRKWNPENWLCLYSNEILLSCKNLLVSFFEMPRSGIGISYCLDVNTGRLNWTTKPSPFEAIACLNDGSFIIGNQGYGAFDTLLYNSKGEKVQHWKTVGRYVVDNSNDVYLIEMNNVSNSKLHASKLMMTENNKVKKGEQIHGYYISDPLIDEYGNIVFWRNESLQVVDKSLKRHVLMKQKTENSHSMTERILMADKGLLVFGLGDKLYLIKTNLGGLAKSSWACKFSNMARNPVVNEVVINDD